MNVSNFMLISVILLQTWNTISGLKNPGEVSDSQYSKDRRWKNSRKTQDIDDIDDFIPHYINSRSSSIGTGDDENPIVTNRQHTPKLYSNRYTSNNHRYPYYYHQPNRYNQLGSPMIILEASNYSEALFQDDSSNNYDNFEPLSNHQPTASSEKRSSTRYRPSSFAYTFASVVTPATGKSTSSSSSSHHNNNDLDDVDMAAYLSSIFKKNRPNNGLLNSPVFSNHKKKYPSMYYQSDLNKNDTDNGNVPASNRSTTSKPLSPPSSPSSPSPSPSPSSSSSPSSSFSFSSSSSSPFPSAHLIRNRPKYPPSGTIYGETQVVSLVMGAKPRRNLTTSIPIPNSVVVTSDGLYNTNTSSLIVQESSGGGTGSGGGGGGDTGNVVGIGVGSGGNVMVSGNDGQVGSGGNDINNTTTISDIEIKSNVTSATASASYTSSASASASTSTTTISTTARSEEKSDMTYSSSPFDLQSTEKMETTTSNKRVSIKPPLSSLIISSNPTMNGKPVKGGNLSLVSSTLNVVGGDENSTTLAHSVLVVNRRRPCCSSSSLKPGHQIRSTTENYPTPLSSNHRPGVMVAQHKPTQNRPWFRPSSSSNKPSIIMDSITSSLSSSSSSSSSSPSSSSSSSSQTATSPMPFPFFDEEVPILMSNNHRKTPYSPVTKNKLTTEYANYWTTPSSVSFTNRVTILKPPIRPIISNAFATSSSSSSTSSFSPFSSFFPTSSSIQQTTHKPHLQVSYVNGNKDKNPDSIHSGVLTVLDAGASGGNDGGGSSRPSSTIVHKNVLVAYKPGRPKPEVTMTTTQHPIWPIIAGFQKWPPSRKNYTSPCDSSSPFSSCSPPEAASVPLTWDDDTSSSTPSTPPQVTSKSPLDTLDAIPVSSIHRPTIAVFGSKPYRPFVRPIPSQVPSSFDVPTRYPPVSNQPHVTLTIAPVTVSYDHVHSYNVTRPYIGPSSSFSSSSSSCGSCSSDLSSSATSQSFLITTTTSTTPPSISFSSTPGSLPFPFELEETTKRPSDTYFHAIYAPPMPSRPMRPSPPPANSNALLALFGVDSFSGLFARLTIVKSLVLLAMLVMLPPFTVLAAMASMTG
ncbi:uncharacterized protein LOC141857607 [Brevipalpus obovatus]|uniref:uncharacterized protein LOC141857607 n=1 Tax=Brevipalpus obovatus TaxID=246614 RepID=UPI003D9EBD82